MLENISLVLMYLAGTALTFLSWLPLGLVYVGVAVLVLTTNRYEQLTGFDLPAVNRDSAKDQFAGFVVQQRSARNSGHICKSQAYQLSRSELWLE